MPGKFDQQVFLNCPIDDEYRPILLTIVFTILYFGYVPRLSLERADSSEARIQKIVELIKASKFGIHDLSRMISTTSGEMYRMNMPFELGIDYGCKMLKDGKWSQKKILILDKERYRFHRSISDLSGSDIKEHGNRPELAVIAVRDWFITENSGTGHSGVKVWDNYNEFQAYLHDEAVVRDGHASVDEVQIPEVITHMKKWFEKVSQV